MGFWDQVNPFAKNPGGPRGAFREMVGIGGSDFNARESALNRDFQADMSNTAHQREMADMRRSGINPMLSVMGGSGASSPSGGQASAAASTNLGDLAAQGIQSALAVKQNKLENNLLKTQEDKAKAEKKGIDISNHVGEKNNQILDATFKSMKNTAVKGAQYDNEQSDYDLNSSGIDAIFKRFNPFGIFGNGSAKRQSQIPPPKTFQMDNGVKINRKGEIIKGTKQMPRRR